MLQCHFCTGDSPQITVAADRGYDWRYTGEACASMQHVPRCSHVHELFGAQAICKALV